MFMNRRRINTVDGFRPNRRINKDHKKSALANKSNKAKELESESKKLLVKKRPTIKNNDFENDYDLKLERSKPKKRRSVKEKTPKKKKKSGFFRVLKLAFVLVFFLGIVWVGNTVNKAYKASNNIFKGNVLGLFNKAPIKQDKDGRTNVLIFGTSEDDYGHDGAMLTDSIMVASYKHSTKKITMISVPRDLWVKLDKPCNIGYKSRINAVYQCASDSGKNEEDGAEALKKKISEVLGIDIQYYAHVNFTVVEKMVDAVGGIEITIESNDRRGIYDPAFDKWCNHKCNFVKYKNGPTGTLDGKHALALAMVRNSHGGYGLPNSNFDREKNQQKIATAIIEKAISSEDLLTTNKINNVLDAVGNNLRTNVKTDEVQSAIGILRSLPKDFDFSKMRSVGFMSDGKNIVKNALISGQQVLVSVDGVDNYQTIHQYIQSQLNPELSDEKAKIDVLNGSEIAGLASKFADKLKKRGINVKKIGNAEEKYDGKIMVYRLNKKPFTEKVLKKEYGLKINTKIPEEYHNYQSDYIIVLGQAYGEK